MRFVVLLSISVSFRSSLRFGHDRECFEKSTETAARAFESSRDRPNVSTASQPLSQKSPKCWNSKSILSLRRCCGTSATAAETTASAPAKTTESFKSAAVSAPRSNSTAESWLPRRLLRKRRYLVRPREMARVPSSSSRPRLSMLSDPRCATAPGEPPSEFRSVRSRCVNRTCACADAER